MPKAVRFDRYGDVNELYVAEVPRPVPGPGEVLVEVRAAGINPGEGAIRTGALHELWPAAFPSGQGTDLAGVVAELGPDVTTAAVGDEVIGWVDTRSSHAQFTVVDAANLVPRPSEVSWEEAGALPVVGFTAWAATTAVRLGAGDTVVVSGAAGGVGSLAVQLARLAGARVIGLAGEPNHEWLADHDIVPVGYGDGVAGRIRATAGAPIDAFIDTFGAGYVDLAVELGVAPERIDTIIDWEAAARVGTRTDGNAVGASTDVLAELAGLIDTDQLELSIAASYPLDEVRAAYTALERRHTRGKIVLIP